MLLKTDLHPAVVSALLGHAQISTTMDVYSHLVPGLAATASGAVRGQIWGETNGSTEDSSGASDDGGGSQLSSELSSTEQDSDSGDSTSPQIN